MLKTPRMTAYAALISLAVSPLAIANPVVDAVTSGSAAFSCTYSDGNALVVNYAADGTFKADNGLSGEWKRNGDELCLTINGNEAGCATVPSDAQLGKAFTMTDIYGQPVECTVG